MIATISQQDSASELVVSYLETITNKGFSGDTDATYGTRLTASTDNSIYQQIPQGVIFPKSEKDIQIALQTAAQDPFLSLTFGPRGGGTGTNGQSLTPGIVVDLSRYMREILEINTDEGWVRVQTGVIKDQLNDFLRPYGFFFAPDLSTSNRATIGGMVNTDASGQGSLVYGKTSDHVLGLTTFLVDGTQMTTNPIAIDKAKLIAEQDTVIGNLYATVLNVCLDNRDSILQKFPRLNRFLTGYDLEHVLSDDLQTFDMSRLITGSEGSLGIVTEAKLNITSIAEFKTLINIKYDSFDSALRHSPFLVEARATSVETVDSKVLNLARQDIVWHSVSDLITDVENKDMQGLNMVEFNAVSPKDIKDKVDTLCRLLDECVKNQTNGVIGYQLTSDKTDILKIYGMRKKSVGLLGNVKGSQKPLAFAEDTAVPPENLADFIVEFRALLDSHNLQYGMFGHVDAGVLHVRPALDMCDPKQEQLLRVISDDVVKLTAKYGGLMWGEHGKGYRSEYGPEFFGDHLFKQLRIIKAAFDPHNRINPGKICTPIESEDSLVSVDGQKRSWFDKQISVDVKTSFNNAMTCNGNGICFNYDEKSPMCPSYKVTGDRRNSPKGRASLMREWLRLQESKDIDLLEVEKQLNEGEVITWWERYQHNRNKNKGVYDFSHEVKESMDECLACKACTTACPIKVDVPTFRSRFLNYYHSYYARPLKDYLVANIENSAPVMASFSKVINPIVNTKLVSSLIKKTVGYVDTPTLSSPRLTKRIGKAHNFNFEKLSALSSAEQNEYVLIVQDPFTSFYEAELVESFIKVIIALGKKPILLPFKPNGKPQHVKGFLNEFKRTAKNAAQFLNSLSEINAPLVGLDASLVMCYRDEYNSILGELRGDFEVLLAHEWLATQSFKPLANKITNDTQFTLLSHCTETTAIPKAANVWQNIFSDLRLSLNTTTTGCCGMAGTYGHEAQNQSNSRALYEMSWQTVIKKNKPEQLLATGFSCRSQVKRYEKFKPKHPIELLAQIL
ncbi:MULTISPECIES: FAD-binding and (Fe-S)-binding domain-containing protein [unclassified Pseudoalteromonas]|uniref:D-2-hydroxyglutarate dehydrogenase YdiJ n=1 Tax=unclassified Pseudoalteromonas TaxID=194690 RepID=UPI0025B4CC11|nr:MULTISPECIES: FAD-binding and (Fe-S)-binding domain-containing protein [unclassified Pseudoalteromonas]MDN3379579.1 FAD-binding and (Fe-S)-binding domain-containing protein [Pseudoalteromonas sp. APC 3893]MDN3387919.1 FAD-binding and (Fe-S)-binding domain-containing protein [Pseudoalteromonas sp. APC 4017]